MQVHQDDHFLIVSDLLGIFYVLIGLSLGINPLFMSILLVGKVSELYLRYRRYDKKDLKFSLIGFLNFKRRIYAR